MNEKNMHEQNGLRSRLAMFKKLNVCVGVIAIGLWSSLASAVTLEDVSFSSLPGERLEVTMKFDGHRRNPPVTPSSARLASPWTSRTLPVGSTSAVSRLV